LDTASTLKFNLVLRAPVLFCAVTFVYLCWCSAFAATSKYRTMAHGAAEPRVEHTDIHMVFRVKDYQLTEEVHPLTPPWRTPQLVLSVSRD
jgi:hypothetical protein